MPDSPYSVITISTLCLLFYGVSWALVRFKVISSDGQRRFWNILLLISVFVAGSIGLLLAVTVNLKINLPVVDKLLIWHVDFGTALVLIAIFHFLHHLKYYRNLFSKTGSEPKISDVSIPFSTAYFHRFQPGFNLKGLPFSLGFTTMATQLILIREFLSVFNGNELTIGIVLSNWLLLTGAGAFLHRKSAQQAILRKILNGLFILAIIPVVTLFVLYGLRNIILPVGSLPSLGQIFVGTILLLSPFCLFSGWLFSAISQYLSDTTGENAISLTYGWETIGSIVSGVLCSMILVFLFEPFQNMAVVLLINTILLFFVSRIEIYSIRKKFRLYLATAFFLGFVTLIANPDKITIQFLFPEQKIISFKDTPYGKLVVTEQSGQLNFFDNNTLLFTTNNIITNEETVHYALLQREFTGNVLLVGGSISGVAEECLKYPLQRLDCAELNPRIPGFGRRLNLLPGDPRFRLYSGDARVLLQNSIRQKSRLSSGEKSLLKELNSLSYDVVILNVPEPSTLQINRFYTYEFFSKCKNLLTEQGIVCLSLMSTADYVGDDALKIQSTLYQTLKAIFRNVLVIPGEKNFFLASDGTLTASVASLGAKRGIETEYVNEYYLDDISMKERSDAIMKRISVTAPLNFDFEPVGCFRQLHYWLSYQWNFSFYLLVIPLLLLLVFAGIRSAGTTIALFSAGLVSFSLEIILILTFQVIYGYAYIATGIFITLFMAGLATGVFFARRYPQKCTYKLLVMAQLASGCMLMLSLASISIFKHFQLPDFLVQSIFSVLIIGMAVITGVQFHIASVLKSGKIQEVAARSYSADLIGSAAGALLVNAWIVPSSGLINALIVVAGINAAVVVSMLFKKHA
jgi:spermidine synthase